MDKSVLPHEMQHGIWCEDFVFRLNCVARTWMRPDAQDNLLYVVKVCVMYVACVSPTGTWCRWASFAVTSTWT